MPGDKSDLLQGTLDMLILKIVALGRSGSGKFPKKCCKCSRGRSIRRCIGWKSAAGWMPSGANPKRPAGQVLQALGEGAEAARIGTFELEAAFGSRASDHADHAVGDFECGYGESRSHRNWTMRSNFIAKR
jgi:hypothetical protein